MMPASIELAGEKAGIGGSELGFEVCFAWSEIAPLVVNRVFKDLVELMSCAVKTDEKANGMSRNRRTPLDGMSSGRKQ